MESIFGIFIITSVAAITPGPNNIIVMNIAAKNGFSAALNPILGILLGATILTFVAWAGIAVIVASNPLLNDIIGTVGASYLLWLGGTIIYKSHDNWLTPENLRGGEVVSNATPSSLAGIFVFQFMNPKAWILITTVATELATKFSAGLSLVIQLIILLSVSVVCLLFWAKLGSNLSSMLAKPKYNLMFNLLMGILLIVPAVSFLVMG